MVTRIESLSWADYEAASGVSNSMLKWISSPEYSPAHYRARFITKELADEDTPAKAMGRLAHRVVLEPDTMEGAFHVRPEGLKFTTKEGMAWRDTHQDRPILTLDEATTARKMRDAVWMHPEAKRLLSGARSEVCVFATDKDGTERKARIDALPKGDPIVDLKFVDDLSERSISKKIFAYRWFCQGPYYVDTANLAGQDRTVFVFIFVEKTPPYTVRVRPLGSLSEDIGRKVYKADLARLRECLEKNSWPGYPHDGDDIEIPEREIQAATFI